MFLKDEHIFTIKTKDALNVAAIKAGGANITISGLNVLREQIKLSNLVFVVFGGDKPSWATGFVGMAVISREPYDDGYDAKNKKNFKVDIDVKVYFDPPLTRTDLVSYPDTFDTIGIGPITKWEPNQAITSVGIKNAIGLFQATCDLRPNAVGTIRNFLGIEATILDRAIRRFVLTTSNLGDCTIDSGPLNGHRIDLRADFIAWAPNKKPGRNGKAASADTIKKYIGYLACLTKPVETHGTTAGWNGLYEFVYGCKPLLYYYEIDTKDRLNEIYGFLHLVFDGGAIPDGVNATNFATVQAYFGDKEMKKHSCLPSAYEAYEEFLEWREMRRKSRVSSSASAGLLSIALRLFAEGRKGEWLEQGRAVNERQRVFFGQFTPEKIAALSEADVKELFCHSEGNGEEKFVSMWSGKSGQGWPHIDPAGDGAKLQAERDYLGRLKADAAIAATYWSEGNENRPSGFGPSVVTELLMKFHPEQCIKHGAVSREALTYLKLLEIDKPYKSDYSEEEYTLVRAAATVILGKMRAMKLPRFIKADGSEDESPPDYLTVNEFLWFVSENLKEIQNEVMKMRLETPTNVTNAGNKEWKDVLSDKPDDMMNRLVAALLTKPFAILAGASGTGKSRMVRKLAYMTCLNSQLQPDPQTKKPIENFRMVQVKPNWHDSSDLLGYRSSVSGSHDYVSTDFVRFILKAHAFPNTPFFVCLDEMNLAPVEHYFAEFLSASESARIEDGEYMTDPIIDPGEFYGNIANLDPQGYSIPQARKDLIEKRGLYLPKNLFVVGTVNMDDTTGGFSRKVLDRAMTIEMNEVNFDDLQKPVELRLMDVQDAQGNVVEKGLLLKAPQVEAFIDRIAFKHDNFDDPFKVQLEDIRSKLATTTLAFAYRFARECVQYRDALRMLFPNVAGGPQYDHGGFALDHMFLMKILPRLVGNAEDREPIVKTLETFFATLTGHDVSAKKLSDMKKASESNGGFLSYYL